MKPQQTPLTTTPIVGLFVIAIDVHGDNRGWFKENWNRQKLQSYGLPDLGPVQNNISFNRERGTTRGFHAEPWDKYISVGSGSVFGAWVDLRAGEGYGRLFTMIIDPGVAVYVPRGVANAFQTLEDNTVYTYLVNDHWSLESTYVNVNLADPVLGVSWPIDLNEAIISDKDRNHPLLADIEPIPKKKTLIIGAGGQLGRALCEQIPHAVALGHQELDISNGDQLSAIAWNEYDVVINAAAYTNVDGAETLEGRRDAWATNAHGVTELVKLAMRYRFVLVHVSTDYVFDGEESEYDANARFAPLNSYGASKAAGDLVVSLIPRHYLVRTSWVIGDGKNFETIMLDLAEKGVNPSVVNDQHGRLTYTQDLATAIDRLVKSGAPYGTYNFTSDGELTTWFDIARRVFQDHGHDPNRVISVTSEEYGSDKTGIARRPKNSNLKKNFPD